MSVGLFSAAVAPSRNDPAGVSRQGAGLFRSGHQESAIEGRQVRSPSALGGARMIDTENITIDIIYRVDA